MTLRMTSGCLAVTGVSSHTQMLALLGVDCFPRCTVTNDQSLGSGKQGGVGGSLVKAYMTEGKGN